MADDSYYMLRVKMRKHVDESREKWQRQMDDNGRADVFLLFFKDE